MRNLFVLTVATMVSVASFGAPTKFSCRNVGDVEEWTIYVDLEKKQAGFFDNDSTVKIALKEIKFLETKPPQTLYVFEGKDTNGGEDSKIQITFNRTKSSASVTLDLGTPSEKTLDALDGCEVDNDVDL